METSETCACCHRDEEGGAEYRLCRHVAEIDQDDEGAEVFSHRVGDVVHQTCGDKTCPTLPVCDNCWENGYYADGTPWWPDPTDAQ